MATLTNGGRQSGRNTMHRLVVRTALVFGLFAVTGAGCTMKNQEAPPLTGPSEFGTSVTVAVSPDVLAQDGASQSVVTVTVRNASGQPLANLPLRAEITVNGQAADFGSLSAKSIVSGADGRATVVYTAPANASGVESIVNIAVTPLSGSYGNQEPRTAAIRLVPPGIVVPPSGLQPAFTVSPENPVEGQGALFSARSSSSPANNPITQYSWDFGDGRTATGIDVTATFNTPGTYFVSLTVRDAVGRSASTTKPVTVGQGTAPTAAFTFSPTDPVANEAVHFNAAASTAGPGRQIVSYRWDYGDGTSDSGRQVAHAFSAVRNYTVTLTITDDIGRTATTSTTVQIN
jgi:PKD repeat protein